MKKFVLLAALVATVATASAQTWKQVSNPFTATSIDGETVSLRAWMDSGYYVVLDYFGVWCGPCWSMHTAGVMESIYQNLGPEGENIVRVAMVEIDNSTDDASIRGTGGGTCGDWTSGGTVPYPIINNVSAIYCVMGFFENAIPYTVFVTPDGRYREFTSAYSSTSSTIVNAVRNYIASAEGSVGIDDAVAASVSVSPNPVVDRLTVEAEAFRSLSVVDMDGRTVLTSTSREVSLGTLPEGIYLVWIDTANGKTVKKIVKK